MTDLDALVDTLLWEGYALYPYTPGATKNATPTPFGIVYPPAYARGSGATHDRVRIECVLAAGGATRPATVRCLGRRSAPRSSGGSSWTGRARPRSTSTACAGRAGLELDGDRWRCGCVNETEVPDGLDRTAALRHSLLSTHSSRAPGGGRFVSPLEAQGCEQVNTWPVLASDADDVVLGAAIMLPDHPQLAPESRGSLFDSTEIEEALLLHVMALSDEERAPAASRTPRCGR